MTARDLRHNEALFVIIYRDAQAHNHLREWQTANKIQHAQVHENRLSLFDHHGLSTFMVTWTKGWDKLVIWDAWHKRHLDIQNS